MPKALYEFMNELLVFIYACLHILWKSGIGTKPLRLALCDKVPDTVKAIHFHYVYTTLISASEKTECAPLYVTVMSELGPKVSFALLQCNHCCLWWKGVTLRLLAATLLFVIINFFLHFLGGEKLMMACSL